ncbi:MAG: hypothetical protein B6244_09405 [Candidatus Cloacimonetes bacterium 4572_55]|nr:MAG: hypothetical protein B6244_09405 [Candidatus Cloacimonetes bacterium 4572_55]
MIKYIRNILFRDLWAKFIALMFSLFLWLIASSDVVYDYQKKIPIRVVGLPEDLILMKDLPEIIEVNLRGKGRDLFQFNFIKPSAILHIKDPAIGKIRRSITPESVTVPGLYNVELDEVISPNYFTLDLDEKLTKELDVKIPQQGELIPNIVLKEEISWKPGRVLVSGPARLLENRDEIYSDTLLLSQIIDDSKLYLPLQFKKNHDLFKIEQESVKVEIWVEQILTFEYKNVPVELTNADLMSIDYRPKTVTVRVTAPESQSRSYKDIESNDLQAAVDARFFRGKEFNLPIWITSHPKLFDHAIFEPSSVLVFRKDPED